MDSREAFKWLNNIWIAKTQCSLNECERDVFLGIWSGKTYREISEDPLRTYQYVKETGAKLFQKVELATGVRVSKKSLKLVIEQFNQQAVSIELEQPASIDSANPFIPLNGVIDRPELFFNRDREIQRIFELLNNRSSVAVVGERAMQRVAGS